MSITTLAALAFVQLTSGNTLRDAIDRATADAEALTPTYEAGGAIYQCGATYVYSVPVTQRSRTGVAIEVAQFADTCRVVALYHTHPRGDARFSHDDIAAACSLGVPSFIRPHGGALRMFDCAALPQSVRTDAWRHPVLSLGVEVSNG